MNSGPPPIAPIAPPSPSGKPSRKGLAIASLVLGVVALFLSLAVIGLIVGLVGIVLGVMHIAEKRGSNAMAWWGMALSFVAILASVGLGIVYWKGLTEFRSYFASLSQGMQYGEGNGGDVREWEGVLAPEIAVTTLDGQMISLSDLKGKRVVLDFWATWCGPCVTEIPHFNKLHAESSRQELVIVGISKEDQATLRAFVKKKGIQYSIASASGLPAPYGDVSSLPTTFFIDRNGVIQSVAVGARDFEQLKSAARAEDFQGEPATGPAVPAEFETSASPLSPVEQWSAKVSGVQALCVGDWDQDGAADILAADVGKKLHVLGADGKEKRALTLPANYTAIKMGRHKTKGVRLLGYVNWDRQVTVLDAAGKQLWVYKAGMGVNGAHWGDLDGDGTDELIAGMNGLGGLHAVNSDGKQLWRAAGFGNVWNQAVVPADEGRSALVFATEASGAVQVLDGKGAVLRVLRPRGKYCTQLTAGLMNSNEVQVIAQGQDQTLVFDENGRIAFWAPARQPTGQWQNSAFASGDVDADGVREWVFVDQTGALMVATVEGKQVAALPANPPVQNFVMLPVEGGRALLVVAQGGQLKAYSFQQASNDQGKNE